MTGGGEGKSFGCVIISGSVLVMSNCVEEVDSAGSSVGRRTLLCCCMLA